MTKRIKFIKKIHLKLFLLPTILLGFQCKKDPSFSNRCDLKPDVGPCEALIPQYYYDRKEKKCKEFNWGGCEGIVPFETLEECKSHCDYI